MDFAINILFINTSLTSRLNLNALPQRGKHNRFYHLEKQNFNLFFCFSFFFFVKESKRIMIIKWRIY